MACCSEKPSLPISETTKRNYKTVHLDSVLAQAWGHGKGYAEGDFVKRETPR